MVDSMVDLMAVLNILVDVTAVATPTQRRHRTTFALPLFYYKEFPMTATVPGTVATPILYRVSYDAQRV